MLKVFKFSTEASHASARAKKKSLSGFFCARERNLSPYRSSTAFPFPRAEATRKHGRSFSSPLRKASGCLAPRTKMRFAYFSVRGRGLEPPRLTAYAPQAYVYTNFTTRAFVLPLCPILKIFQGETPRGFASRGFCFFI